MLKRFRYKTWPGPAVTMCGMALYLAAIGVDKQARHLSSLLIGISAMFIAIPVMFVAKAFRHERSNRLINQEALGCAGQDRLLAVHLVNDRMVRYTIFTPNPRASCIPLRM